MAGQQRSSWDGVKPGCGVDRGRAAVARSDLHRGADRNAQRTDRQTAPGRDPASVRLASDGADRADQPGRVAQRIVQAFFSGLIPSDQTGAQLTSSDLTITYAAVL